MAIMNALNECLILVQKWKLSTTFMVSGWPFDTPARNSSFIWSFCIYARILLCLRTNAFWDLINRRQENVVPVLHWIYSIARPREPTNNQSASLASNCHQVIPLRSVVIDRSFTTPLFDILKARNFFRSVQFLLYHAISHKFWVRPKNKWSESGYFAT